MIITEDATPSRNYEFTTGGRIMRCKTYKVTERSLIARKLAIELMLQHGLDDWSFAFNDSLKSAGLCQQKRDGSPGCIWLSTLFCENFPVEQVRDVILHEIAHALCDVAAGHGPLWKSKARELGARPTACGDFTIPGGNWMATCAMCFGKYYRMRAPKVGANYRCGSCKRLAPMLIWQKRM